MHTTHKYAQEYIYKKVGYSQNHTSHRGNETKAKAENDAKKHFLCRSHPLLNLRAASVVKMSTLSWHIIQILSSKIPSPSDEMLRMQI